MNGAITSMTSFRIDVGSGSAAEVWSRNRHPALMTSSVVTVSNVESSAPDFTSEKTGAGASCVERRTLSTYSTKKRLKLATSITSLAGTRPRLSNLSTDCHSFRGLFRSASTAETQKSLNLRRRRSLYRQIDKDMAWSIPCSFSSIDSSCGSHIRCSSSTSSR